MKKRILIFSLAYYPSHVSGAEAAVREITDRIDSSDIEFEMITLWFDRTQPELEKIGNVLVYRVGVGSKYLTKIFFVPIAVFVARKLHKKNPFDGLWALMTYMLFPVVLARFFGVKVPYVLTLQDGDPYEKVFERWFIRPFTPILDYGFKHAKVVQAISSYLATWPKRRGSSVPVEVIHNGGNPRDFILDLFSKEEIQTARKEMGVKDEEILIGNTARLVYQKGWEDTITALSLLPEKYKMLIVGGGQDEEKYKILVKELKLDKRVIFTGQVERSEVTKYRRMLDIFVMPSRSEGLGNAGLSAMASRIPLIATQEGGLAEYVFDAKRNPGKPATGWVVDKDNPEQIRDAIVAIGERPEEVKKIVTNAYDMVSRKFRWEQVAKDMQEKVFTRLFEKEL
jgi:glycosyltransferase involved in cell wall biosynthesis